MWHRLKISHEMGIQTTTVCGLVHKRTSLLVKGAGPLVCTFKCYILFPIKWHLILYVVSKLVSISIENSEPSYITLEDFSFHHSYVTPRARKNSCTTSTHHHDVESFLAWRNISMKRVYWLAPHQGYAAPCRLPGRNAHQYVLNI